jgi:protease-4
MDAVYTDFTTKAAEGRGKPLAELEKNAHGRVWSGADAMKLGLVDEFGGLTVAIDYAKTKIGLQPADVVKIVSYPEPKGSWETIMKAVNDEDTPTDIMTGVRALVALGKFTAPLMQTWDGMQTRGPQLRMEPVAAE